MACTYTFKGKVYTEQEFNDFLSNNPKLKDKYLSRKNNNVSPVVDSDELIETNTQLSTFTSEVNEETTSNVIAPGVDFVFEQNPELATIGTPEQYSKYINTIFPNSKIKDIVYHGSLIRNITTFNKGNIYFTNEENEAFELGLEKVWSNLSHDIKTYFTEHTNDTYKNSYGLFEWTLVQANHKVNGRNVERGFNDHIAFLEKEGVISKNFSFDDIVKIYPAVLDIRNPNYLDEDARFFKNFDRGDYTGDGIIGKDAMPFMSDNRTDTVYLVFEPEQIHILGNKQDMTDFNVFVKTENLKSIQPAIFSSDVDYHFKAVDILLSDKAKQVFDKGQKNNWSLDKILTELGVPKEQKGLISKLNTKDREEIILNLVNDYTYTVKIETAKEEYTTWESNINPFTDEDESIEVARYRPAKHYANFTVPGGINYTEERIVTPNIIPNITVHPEFAKSIGWFRADDKYITTTNPLSFIDERGYRWEKINNVWYITDLDGNTKETRMTDTTVYTLNNKPYLNTKYVNKEFRTNTRRILEIQSDMFQKWRNSFRFNNSDYKIVTEGNDKHYFKDGKEITSNEYNKTWDAYLSTPSDNENTFLKLLQKEDNWVTFFIKAIVQDSAKKGYEKVLFPNGETAAKIEGHQTIADDINKIDLQLNSINDALSKPVSKDTKDDLLDLGLITEDSSYEYIKQVRDKDLIETKNRLEKEKINLKSQGIEKLKPVEAFYENRVTNILNKNYKGVTRITDEYDNTWNELVITDEMRNDIQLSMFASEVATSESNKMIEGIHSFLQGKLSDYANRTKAFPDDSKSARILDELRKNNIALELAYLDLEQLAKALEADYNYNFTTLNNKYGILDRLTTYENMNMEDIVNNDVLRKEFTNFMRHTNTFLKSFNRINTTLRSVKDTTDEWTEVENTLNKLVTWHQELAKDIINATTRYNDLVDNFFTIRNTQVSTNPNIEQGIMDLFTAQDDENNKQLWLDAMADTNNTFIATTIKNYVREMGEAEKEYTDETNTFRKAIMSTFGLTDPKQIASLTADKFEPYLELDLNGTPTGRVVQKYDLARFYKDRNDMLAQAASKFIKDSAEYDEFIENWYAKHTVQIMFGEDMMDVINLRRASLSTKQFEEWFKRNIKVTIDGVYKPVIGGEFGAPTDEYINSRYLAVKDTELYKYLTTNLITLASYHGRNNMVMDGFIPAMSDKTTNIFDIKAYYERHLAKKPNQFRGENDEMIRLLSFPMIERLNQQPLIPISDKFKHENYKTYTARVLRETEEAGYGTFNSLADIRAENRTIADKNRIEHGKAFNKNIGGVVEKFIKEAIIFKHKKNIESEVTMALHRTDRLRFVNRKPTGEREENYNATKELYKKQYSEIENSNSRVKRHFDQWLEAVFYDNFDIDEGQWTAISKLLLKYVSAKNMWINISSAMNNVVYGNLQIKVEKAAGYFVNGKHLADAEKEYWANISGMIADLGSETSDNLTVAILKRANIVEAQTEKEVGAKIVYKHLISTDSLYMLQEIGEHWMQNKMLLAMMRSHRIVDGKAQSFVEFKGDNRKDILKSILTEDEMKQLDEYIKVRLENEQYIDAKHNYIEDYLISFVSTDKVKQYNEIRKKSDEELLKEFEELPQVRDAFELDNGVAVVKKTEVGEDMLSGAELGEFFEKVIKVNQYIHGIYNKKDASTFQRRGIGKLAMQFRKFMIPGWNKRFGTKFFGSFWNEARRSWDKGAYDSFIKFAGTPLRGGINDLGNAEETGRAFGRIMRDYAKFIRNLKLYYNVLDDSEKANVKRTLYEMSMLTFVMVLGFILGNMRGDDDDKDKPYLYDLAMYQLDRMGSELGFYTPFGWWNEGSKIMRAPAAVTSAISDAMQLAANSIAFVVSPDGRYYEGGIYNGELKIGNNAAKMIPIYNQFYKLQRIDKMNRYYNLFFF